MQLIKIIKDKSKTKEIVFGFKNVMKELKTGKTKLVVISKNFPEKRKKIVLHNIKLAKAELKEHPKDNIDLGLVCGKPFSTSILAIKGEVK